MTKRPFIKALLIDISGNLHVGSTPTPGAVEAIQSLRRSNIPFRLCSNASKESTSAVVRKLNEMGFDFTARRVNSRESAAIDGVQEVRQEVWTSIASMSQYVQDRGFKRPYVLLSDSARQEVLPERDSNPGSESSEAKYDAVVVGLAPHLFDYEHLNTAFRMLKGEHGTSTGSPNSGLALPVPLIATHKARFIEKSDPPGLSLGPGPFVTALEDAAGCKAHIVGKPTKTFFELVINDLPSTEMPDGKIAVIGDDVEADLGGGALELGLWRVLVKTGKYRKGDESRQGVIPPDEVHETFASFIDHLLSSNDGAHAHKPTEGQKKSK